MKKIEPALRRAFKIGQAKRRGIKLSFPSMGERRVEGEREEQVARDPGGGVEAIRATLYARLRAQKARVTALSLELGVPIPTLEAFAQGTADLTPPILEALCLILWGDKVTYCADDDALVKNGERFTPDAEVDPRQKRRREEEKLRMAAIREASRPREASAARSEETRARMERTAARQEEQRKHKEALLLPPRARRAAMKALAEERRMKALAEHERLAKDVVF